MCVWDREKGERGKQATGLDGERESLNKKGHKRYMFPYCCYAGSVNSYWVFLSFPEMAAFQHIMEWVFLQALFMCGTKGTLRAVCIERYDAISRHVYYGLTSQMQNRVRGEGITGNRTALSGADISPCVLGLTQRPKQTKGSAYLISKPLRLVACANT